MAKKYILISIIIGVILGSFGTYYSNYALNLLGIDELSIPSIDKKNDAGVRLPDVPKSILTNELRYNLIEVKKTDFGINGEKPLEGGVFLVVKIEIENLGKKEVTVFGKNWFLKDIVDRVYTPKTFSSIPENGENIFSVRIPPGFKITQNVGFEIPSKLESTKELYVPNKAFESEPIFLGVV